MEIGLILQLIITTYFFRNFANSSITKGFTSFEHVKIIGGEPAIKGEFPWMLSLQYKNFLMKDALGFNKSNLIISPHFCGATLINSTHAITAAHCVFHYELDTIQVIAGAYNIENVETTQQKRTIERVIIHPNYENNEHRIRHDFAALIVYPPFQLSTDVQPIELPPSGHHTVSGSCIIAGWGQTMNGLTSDILQKAVIPIVRKEKCKTRYGDRLDEDNQICAGYENGGVDVCVGDTGGPLMCYLEGSYYCAGIASWGYRCAAPKSPGVYTEVSVYQALYFQ